MLRWTTLCVVFFTCLANAVVEHGTVFPITETAQTYSAEDNYYDSTYTNKVRFSYTPAKSGLCTVSSSYKDYSFYRYLYYYETDDTFSNYKKYGSGYYTPSLSFKCDEGETYYFAVVVSSSSDYDEYFDIKMVRRDIAIVSVQGRTYPDTVAQDTSLSITASLYTGERFAGWKIDEGTGSFVDAKSRSTYFTPTSEKVTLSYNVEKGEVYEITKTEKKYNLYDNYYSISTSSGVRFFFVAPADGGYVFKLKKDSTEYAYFRRYPTGTFSSYEWSVYRNDFASDSLALAAGDSVFYTVTSYYTRDSLMSFSISYDTLPTVKLTVESSSPGCSTTVGSRAVLKNTVVSIEAVGYKGYRPDGWTFVSGSHKFRDSTAYSLRDTIVSDTKIRLNCREAKLIDVTDKPQTYTPTKDFYEISPSSGLRFRYEAPTSGIYVLRYQPNSLYGSYRYHGDDSTFMSSKRSVNSTSAKSSFNLVASSDGERFYSSVIPYSNSYWSYSVSVVALPAGTVKMDGQTRADTLAVGDSLGVTASLDSGAHFEHWTVVSGKGSFSDSTLRTTSFTLKESAVIKPATTTLPLYELTEQFKGYTFKNNSTQSRSTIYGIRAFFNPPTDGMYGIQMKTSRGAYIYNYTTDSSYFSYSRTSCGAGGCKITQNLTADTKQYYQFVQLTETYMGDSVWIRAVKTLKLRGDTSGTGYVYVGTNSRNYDSTYVSGDTVLIRAYTSAVDQKFSKWTVSSGSCKIIDSTKSYTYVVLNSDCTVKAHFVSGSMYRITDVATKYTLVDNFYSRAPSYGVRYFFVAPSDGSYTFAFRSIDMYMTVERYSNGSFSSTSNSYNGTYSRYETYNLTAGDSIFYIVKNYYTADTLKPFWVNYSQSKINIEVTAGDNGSVSPSRYTDAWSGAAYPITATANSGYRFDKWVFESGTGTFDDPDYYSTVVFAAESVTVKALFRRGDIYPLTTTAETYNFQKHYFSDKQRGTVMFSWTPADTNHYLLKLDSVKGTCAYYETDSLLTTVAKTHILDGGASYIHLQGTPGKTYYFAVTDSLQNTSRNKNFVAQIVIPYVLFVESTRGRAVPSGNVYVAPGADTAVYAIPYGGYNFDSWKVISGSAKIDSSTKSRTRVEPQTNYCHIKADFELDSATVPEVKITDLDLSNHPGICAQVSVVDQNNGKPIAGLDSSDFVLFQDNVSLPAQTMTIQDVSGVSVALVVDESASMSNNSRMVNAKKAIRQFIEEMGPYDRTAIIGFTGDNRADVHQTMTSDKKLLLDAVDRLNADGAWTNINTGAKVGVQQVVGETNPTAVIVFSDGINNHDSTTTAEALSAAHSVNTTFYTIAVETNTNTVLKDLADGTGGTYTDAPSATQLAEIYATIRGSVQSRYVLCYQSPDAVFDGDSHMVEIKTKFMNKNAADTAYWDEGSKPPVVDLTPDTWKLVGVDQPENTSLTIDVYVRSKAGITDVTLHARDVSLTNDAYKSYTMTQVNDSLWRYVIPGSSVKYPGIDFYVVATDSNSLIGKTPAVANPSKEPYTIPVKTDVPVVKMDTLACVDIIGDYGTMRFKVTDGDSISQVTLFYKDTLAVLFNELSMTQVNGYWVASIPSSAFDRNIIEFYVRAIDGVGASSRWPLKQNSRIPACERKQITDVPDVIEIVNADDAHATIGRETQKVGLTLVTEDFTSSVDVVQAKLSCLASGDVEKNIELVEKSSGYFETLNSILKNEDPADRGDGKISCSPSDTLVAEYMDPLFGTYARDTVIINYSVIDLPDTIRIVNADSANAKIVSETKKLNLTLVTEDFTNAVDTVQVKLSCLSSGDIERKIELVEKSSGYFETLNPVLKNVDVAIRGDGEISCDGHDTLVAEYMDPLFGTYARDTVLLDYSIEDVPDTIRIMNADEAQISIERETDKLNLSLVTEDFTKSVDTLRVKLSCLASGDVENNIELVEKESGYYETRKSISKNEYAAKVDDGAISCTGRDTLVAEYKDPLFGTYAYDTVAIIRDSVDFGYKFLDKDGKKDLDSVETGDSAKFRIHLTAYSKSIHVKDTLDVLLLTNKGDSLWVEAIETDVYSSTFEYKGTFFFAYDKSDLEKTRLDALFDLDTSYNRVIITAKVKNDNLGKKRDSLVVFSNYIPADYAEIYDANKDGKADSIRVHFVAKNKDGIEGIDTLYWNRAGGTWRSIAKKKFRMVSKDSWAEASLKEPFDYGATSADGANEPYLRLTKPKGGFSQKVKIKDKIGAVPVKAVKRPGMISIEDYMECSNEVPPDTLVITLSEPVKNTGKEESGKKAAWRKLFTYSADCKDTNNYSLNITEMIKKDSAGLVWSFVLGDHNIMTDNCIRTNPKASYVDGQKNSMGRGGVEIEGGNGNLYLYEVVATPAVSGIGSKAEWIAPKKHKWSRVPDTLSVIRVASIMPYKAYVNIYDGYSNVVASFTREFGENGEMKEEIRGNDENHAKVGFLHWNNRSDEGRKVGTGVYIWRIDFKFKDGHSESRLVKTGVKRKK